MFKSRFIYILFLILLSLVVITLIPVLFVVKKIFVGAGIPHSVAEQIIERLLIIVFYSFILSFIIALFLSRTITSPLNIIKRAAMRVKAGDFDFEIPSGATGEFNEVIKTFNTMLTGLRDKTQELKKKEVYIENMTDPLIVIDEAGLIEDINPAFTRLLGYERNEVMGTKIEEILPSIREFIDKNQRESTSIYPSARPYEGTIISKLDEPIPVLITVARTILNNSEKMLLSIKDFREGLAIREEIKLSRDYLEGVMNSIQDELLVIDRDFRIIKANDAVRKRIGTNPEGKFCYTISHLRERPCEEITCPLKRGFETKRAFVTEHRHIDPEGHFRTYEIVAYPVFEENGEVEHVIEFIRDITDRKIVENELIKKNRELGFLNEVSEILSKSLKLDEIFNSLLTKLKETFGMDGGGIFIIERDILTCKYHSGVSEEFVRQAGRVPIGHDIPGMVAQSKTIITSIDVSKDPRIERSLLRHSGIKGYCCIPIMGKEKIHGVFYLFSYRPYRWSPEDEEILKSVGEMMGLAFENISLYERVQTLYRTLKDKRQKEIEDLSIMVDTLSGTRNIEELLDNSLHLIKEKLNPDLVCFMRPDDSGNILLRKAIPVFSTSVRGQESGVEPIILYKGNVSSQESLSMRERVIIHVRDITQDPRFYYNDLFKRQYISSLTIPLSSGEKNIGCLSLYSKTQTDFTEEEIHFLKIFSTVLSLSLERSEFYEVLLRQEALSTTILDSIKDGVYTVDPKGYITSINRAAEEIFNLRRTQILGKRCTDLIRHGQERPLCDTEGCPLRTALSGSSAISEMEFINLNGRRFILELNCLPLKDPLTGHVNGAVQVLRDVTGQRELDRMKTEIIRNVSHEFRTPLTAIIGMAEMILNGDVKGERARQYLEVMYREGLRLSRMISELLDISRLERKEFFQIGPVDFKKIIENIKEGFSDIIEKKSAIIAFKLDGDLSGFTGDETKIEQILRNLIDNSLNYSDRGVRITVLIKRSGEMIEMIVSDTGWGIPEEDVPHLGERFYRGRHGEVTKGTGLGLSLVKEIVKIHEGMLTIDSQYRRGTSVRIELPYRRGFEQ